MNQKKDLFDNLVNKTKHLTNYTVIPKAVSLVDGTTQFNICKSGGASSILPFRSEEELIKTWSIYRTDVHYSVYHMKLKQHVLIHLLRVII